MSDAYLITFHSGGGLHGAFVCDVCGHKVFDLDDGDSMHDIDRAATAHFLACPGDGEDA